MRDKKISHTARLCLRLWNTILFALVWYFRYNDFVFDHYKISGLIMSVIIYYIVYNFICSVYKAFRFASTSVWELVFSQFVSFGLADLVLYVECCLIHNQYADIVPGVITVVWQLLGSILIVNVTKRYLIRHLKPRKTILIVGKEAKRGSRKRFEQELRKFYPHMFDIISVEDENISQEEMRKKVTSCESVIMYGMTPDNRRRCIMHCVELDRDFLFTPRVEDIVLQGCSYRHLLDTPLMRYDINYRNFGQQFVKRLCDVVFSLLLIIISSPFMLLVAIAIKLEDGGPVLFRQKRCTKDEKVFEIIKFRSMVVDAEKRGVVPFAKNDPRVTKVGSFIRKTRLDELPQLFNILSGDMSFVGPRPERIEHVQMYMKEVPEFKYRMKVKGGLTGYAQVYGKYNTTAYDKLRLDLLYIENQSLIMDFKLLLLTVRTLFSAESTEGFDEEKSENMNRKAALQKKENENEKSTHVGHNGSDDRTV